MAQLALAFDILARDKASANLNKVSASADKVGKSGKGMGVGLKAGLGVAAGLGAVFAVGLGEVKDYQAGLAQLQAGIKSTGGAANVTAPQLEDLASSIQGYSGQTDDSIVASESLLLTFTNVRNEVGKGNDIFTQATKATADLAARMGGDASANAIKLGKALNDPVKGITALQKIGISFDETQKAQIKNFVATGHVAEAQKIILGELNKEVGGSAAAYGKTLPGQIDRSKRAFEDLSQSIVGAAAPALENIAKTVTAGLSAFTALPGPVKAAAIGVTVLGGAALVAIPKIVALKEAMSAAAAQGGATGRLAGGLGKTASVLTGPWGIALAAGVTGLGYFLTKQHQAAAEARAFADGLTFQNGALDANSRATVNDKLAKQGMYDVTKLAGVAESEYLAAVTAGGPARDAMIRQLTNLIGGRTGLALLDDKQAAAASVLLKNLNSESGAIEDQSRASGQAATALGGLTSKTTTQVSASQKLEKALQGVIDKFTILREGALSQERANEALQAAFDGVSSSVKSNGHSLDINTEKGRANRAALIDVATALNDKVKADLEANKSSKGAAAALDIARDATIRNRDALIKQATAAGLSKDQVRDLVSAILKVPTKKSTQIDADTKPAISKVQRLQQAFDKLHDKTVRIDVMARLHGITGGGAAANAARSAAYQELKFGGGHATGGPIYRGMSYLVGEQGPELVTPLQDGYVHTAPKTAAALGRTGPLINIEHVDSSVDLELWARDAAFRERMGVFT